MAKKQSTPKKYSFKPHSLGNKTLRKPPRSRLRQRKKNSLKTKTKVTSFKMFLPMKMTLSP